jgi:hypothetical protein
MKFFISILNRGDFLPRKKVPTCECNIHGKILDPKNYMKVITHKNRQDILHKFHVLTIDEPITKYQLSEALDISYDKVHYQLNEHLNDFWEVKNTVKIRGAYQEYIAPKVTNTIYLNIGPENILYIIDPLAKLFGRLKDVGTRCDKCSPKTRSICIQDLETQAYLQIDPEERAKREQVLENNGRNQPFTPVDYMIVGTVAQSFEQEQITAQIKTSGCPFIEKIRLECSKSENPSKSKCCKSEK